MFIVKLTEDCLGGKAGEWYYMESTNAGQVLVFQEPEHIERIEAIKTTGDTGTLIVRPGGIGDLVHLAATIKACRDRDGYKPDVCVADRYKDVLRHNPHVGKIVSYPLHASAQNDYKTIHWLENSVENEKELHMADAFLNACGFDWKAIDPKDKRPRIYLPEKAKPRIAKGKKPRVGFQVKASARCRTPSPKQLGAVMQHYVDTGWEVWLFGAPGEIQMDDPDIVNTTIWEKPMSIIESAVQMTTCDLFIAPDSGLLHIAGALRIPSVGLYGPFPADLRIRYTPKNICVEAKSYCSPCFWHGRGQHFPHGCPSASTGQCMVLGGITTKSIINAGNMVLKK
jgi:ADP-heptose:LPS heptosyltransferase